MGIGYFNTGAENITLMLFAYIIQMMVQTLFEFICNCLEKCCHFPQFNKVSIHGTSYVNSYCLIHEMTSLIPS